MSAGNNVCYACCVSYFVSAPCHGTTLHPATKGGKWEGLFNNSRAQNPLWLKSTRNCSGGWKGLVSGFPYYIRIFHQIYIYTYTKSYKNISSYIDITYIYRDHDQSLQHTRQTNTDTHPHKHTPKKKEKNERANKCPCSRPPCKYMTVIIYNIYMYIHMSNQTLNCDIGYLNHLCKKTMNAIHTVCFS